ncbi:MAG: glycosyltransferase family 9 protein [Candidatus Marinarcus sp.]|uniref:glycosyltransferase family 9 protein n=1 Tax=Candidatus Marinarcus sp. TaxID=3100987 RepID=UPI003B000BE5
MIFFRVTDNINIKITDGTLIEYKKLQQPSIIMNENIYCTTYEDFKSIQKIFKSVDEKFETKILNEMRVKSSALFPQELGISNEKEYEILNKYEKMIESKKFSNANFEHEVPTYFFNDRLFVKLQTQLNFAKESIKVAIIGGCGKDIGEIVASSGAVRILYEYLKTHFKEVDIDLFLNASSNTYYTRDKEILQNLPFIHAIKPLSLNLKVLSMYDYYIDNSSIRKQTFYNDLPYIDAYLFKFGIDYNTIPDVKKFNEIHLDKYRPKKELEDLLINLKSRGKVLLFHPYSADNTRSIPHEYAKSMLNDLMKKCDDYTVITALDIEGVKNENYITLAKYSKTFSDFAYIISNMDRVITVDTATYHISDAFFIPTVVLFTNDKMKQRLKYYKYVKGIHLKNSIKTLSKFIFRNDALSLNPFDCWKNIKISKVIKLLEKIR